MGRVNSFLHDKRVFMAYLEALQSMKIFWNHIFTWKKTKDKRLCTKAFINKKIFFRSNADVRQSSENAYGVADTKYSLCYVSNSFRALFLN